MADTKISAFTGAQLAAHRTAAWQAGSATAGSWPVLGSGTLLTTAEAGAFERDANCIYACTDAGNRGIIPVTHFIRADSTRTYTSNTSAQPVFNSPTNGRLTLETGCYLFEGLLAWTAMEAAGTSNRSLNMLGAGTATVGAWLWMVEGIDGALNTLLDLDNALLTTNATAASMVTGVANANLRCRVRGTFEVTGAGTIIPSTTMVVAAASVLSIGSFLLFNRIGSTSVTNVGQWD